MALNVGSVSIDPNTGATIAALGVTGEAFNVLLSKTNFGTLSVSNPIAYAKAKQQLADIAEAIATCVSHVITNAQINGIAASGIPVATTGTASAQTGATIATGVVSGTVF